MWCSASILLLLKHLSSPQKKMPKVCYIVGGVASPILANVYLHELDEKAEEIRARWERGGKRKHRNPLHRKLSAQKERLVKKGATRTKAFRTVVQRIRSIPAVEVNDPNFIRIKYLSGMPTTG